MYKVLKVWLKEGKEQSLKRFHPWVFSGAIKKIETGVVNGSTVEVYSGKEEYLATGHYQQGSIAVRIFSFKKIIPDAGFWESRIRNAYNYRESLGITGNAQTNVYRLINAEGDGLPGLIVDFYNGTAVIQTHSFGMENEIPVLAQALKDIYGDILKAIYKKTKKGNGNKKGEDVPLIHSGQGEKNEYLYGSDDTKIVIENGNKFKVDWETGQKTGFFIDQRDNRKLVSQYSKGKRILDCFCYNGGFSVYCLQQGASEVHSLDSSENAIQQTCLNVSMNFGTKANHKTFSADVFDFLKENPNQYDVIILDPPAFAKHLSAKHHAIQGYIRLNMLAMKCIRQGGAIFTFSCSQVIDRRLFAGAVTAAAIEAKRNIRIFHSMSQSTDHPVNIFHPEGEYLKGLALHIGE